MLLHTIGCSGQAFQVVADGFARRAAGQREVAIIRLDGLAGNAFVHEEVAAPRLIGGRFLVVGSWWSVRCRVRGAVPGAWHEGAECRVPGARTEHRPRITIVLRTKHDTPHPAPHRPPGTIHPV